jgi:CBS domain-containing protein
VAGDQDNRTTEPTRVRRRRRGPEPVRHGLDLSAELDELVELRLLASTNLSEAGERALKTLDRFLGTLANALGMNADQPGMGDAIRWLARIDGMPRSVADQAERFRGARNALAHNPDLMLRPEAALRVLDGVEKIIRMTADRAYDLARRPPVTVAATASAFEARSRMLSHGYRQLVVVDGHGKLADILTDRDLVTLESLIDLDGDGNHATVAEAIATRDYLAVAPVGRHDALAEVVDRLQDERVAAAVVTENGRIGETPLGVITRNDLLRRR